METKQNINTLDSLWDQICSRTIVWSGKNFLEINSFCTWKYYSFYGVDKPFVCFVSRNHLWIENLFSKEQIKATIGDSIKFDWRNKKFIVIPKHLK